MVLKNKFAGTCADCGTKVPAGAGNAVLRAERWITRCASCRPVVPERGDHAGWHRGRMLVVDTETTGIDPRTDRIVTVALVDSLENWQHEWLVNPGVEIPEGAAAVHGISTEHAVAHGRPPAEVLQEVAVALWNALIESGGLLLAYNAPFDLTLLSAELRRYGLPDLPWDQITVIDPYVLVQGIWGKEIGLKLGEICAFYGVDLTNAHTATDDAAATLLLAQEIAARHPELAGMDGKSLMEHQRDLYRRRAEAWNEYAQRKGRALDDPAGWPIGARAES